MYCPQCGTEAEESTRFCAKCGRALSGSTGQARPANNYAPRADIPNHLVWAILSTIFCCLPTGIVSIVYAAQVNGKVALGDYEAARKASEMAKNWAGVSVVLGIISGIIYLLLYIISDDSFLY